MPLRLDPAQTRYMLLLYHRPEDFFCSQVLFVSDIFNRKSSRIKRKKHARDLFFHTRFLVYQAVYLLQTKKLRKFTLDTQVILLSPFTLKNADNWIVIGK